ncbi:MAG: hypothetical protein ACRDTJ_15465 [Pseudonocardiaceae bacterium]
MATFGADALKVGISAVERGDERLLEQGALAFTWIAQGSHRIIRAADMVPVHPRQPLGRNARRKPQQLADGRFWGDSADQGVSWRIGGVCRGVGRGVDEQDRDALGGGEERNRSVVPNYDIGRDQRRDSRGVVLMLGEDSVLADLVAPPPDSPLSLRSFGRLVAVVGGVQHHGHAPIVEGKLLGKHLD